MFSLIRMQMFTRLIRMQTFTCFDPDANVLFDPDANVLLFDPAPHDLITFSNNVHVLDPDTNVHLFDPDANVHLFNPDENVQLGALPKCHVALYSLACFDKSERYLNYLWGHNNARVYKN